MKIDPSPSGKVPTRVPTLEQLCREIASLRADLVRARVSLTRPGYHLDLDGNEAAKTAVFLCELQVRVTNLQRLIARHREMTGREDFEDAVIVLGMLRREPKVLFAVSGRQWHDALLLPSELLAAAVAEGKQPKRKKRC